MPENESKNGFSGLVIVFTFVGIFLLFFVGFYYWRSPFITKTPDQGLLDLEIGENTSNYDKINPKNKEKADPVESVNFKRFLEIENYADFNSTTTAPLQKAYFEVIVPNGYTSWGTNSNDPSAYIVKRPLETVTDMWAPSITVRPFTYKSTTYSGTNLTTWFKKNSSAGRDNIIDYEYLEVLNKFLYFEELFIADDRVLYSVKVSEKYQEDDFNRELSLEHNNDLSYKSINHYKKYDYYLLLIDTTPVGITFYKNDFNYEQKLDFIKNVTLDIISEKK